MGLSNQAARGAVTTIAGQALKFVIQIGTLVVLARLLTPADYGVITMITAVTGIALVLGDFGLSLAAVQAKVLTQGQKSNLFWLNSLIGVVSGAAVFAAAIPLANFYGEPVLVDLTRALSVIFVFSGINTQFKAELTRRMQFKSLAFVEVFSQLFGLIIAVASALLGLAYWALALQQISIAACTLTLSILFSRWAPGRPRRNQEMRSLITFGANTMGVQLVTYVSNNVDSVLLGRVWGATTLGLYNRAYQMFTLPMQQLAAPMTRVALPVLSRITDRSQYLRFVEHAQLLLAYALCGCFAAFAAVAAPGFTILFGAQWAGAAPIFQALAIGGVFQALGYVYYWIFLSKALTGVQLRYSLLGRSVLIVCVCLGVQWGAIGVAFGYSAGLFVLWLLYSVFAIRKADVPASRLILIAMRPVTIYTLAFLSAQVPLLVAHSELWLTLSMQVAAFAAVLGLSLLIAPVRRDVSQIVGTARLLRIR